MFACLGLLLPPLACAAPPTEAEKAGSPGQTAKLPPNAPELPAPLPQDDAADEAEQPPTVLPPPEPAAAAQPTEEQARDLAFLRQILLNPASEPASRSEAAARLLAMDLPQAIQILDEILRGDQEPPILAVLSALQSAPRPATELTAPCLEALRSAPPTTRDALRRVLVRYGEAALPGIAQLAEDQQAAAPERIGAIHALGAFRTHSCAAHLMILLDPERNEPKEIVQETCRSLQRLSASPRACEPERWRQWWTEVRDLSVESWNEMIVRNLAARIAELEQAAETERVQRLAVMQRLGAAYGDLFPVLAIADQLARLPAMLDDELTTVRQFAIGRIERIMRDSVRIPPPVQQKLAERLANDPTPDIRRQAVQLLDQQNYEGITALLTDRLGKEKTPQVAAAMLGVLTRRPTATAIGPVTQWLGHAEVGKAAADALWALPTLSSLAAEQRQSVLKKLRGINDAARTAAHVRLLAAIGEDADLTQLEDLMDGDDQAKRLAVAEGFARRGHRQPLLDRVDDPLIRPLVYRVLAEGPADLANFQLLASLRPANEQNANWGDAARALSRRLGLVGLLDADAVLAGLNPAPTALRAGILLPVAEAPPADATPQQRTLLLVRLAPLLMTTGRAPKAHELLVQLNGVPDSPELLRVKFRAAALSGHYDNAAQLTADPAGWVSALRWIVEVHADSARTLRDEIARRFAEQLTGDLKTEFDAASAKLPALTPAETPAVQTPATEVESAPPPDEADKPDDAGAPG